MRNEFTAIFERDKENRCGKTAKRTTDTHRRRDMPIVNLKVLGTLTDDQKRELVKRFTKDLEEVAGKPPEYTYVVIEEVPRTHWGHKGVLFADKK